jgi:hypothetical protein
VHEDTVPGAELELQAAIATENAAAKRIRARRLQGIV